MKKLIIAQVIAAFFLSPLCFADWHQFTSADGAKKVMAEVLGFDEASQMATLQLEGNRRIQAPVSSFIEEDQALIKKAAVAMSAGRNLWVEFEDEEKELSEKRNPANGYRTVNLASGFKLELRNNGTAVFEGLTAEYQVFYAAYVNPFKDRARTDKVTYKTMALPALQPREEAFVSTNPINLTRITKLPLSQCSGGT
tara:strand:- start:198 stop:788 length:591 start_codon:yes stop_codon:yes gene_type:complete